MSGHSYSSLKSFKLKQISKIFAFHVYLGVKQVSKPMAVPKCYIRDFINECNIKSTNVLKTVL